MTDPCTTVMCSEKMENENSKNSTKRSLRLPFALFFFSLVVPLIIIIFMIVAQFVEADKKVSPSNSNSTNSNQKIVKRVKEIHQRIERVKVGLAKKNQYVCCIKPSCDFCLLSMANCRCGANLLTDKPICPECAAGITAGQGIFFIVPTQTQSGSAKDSTENHK